MTAIVCNTLTGAVSEYDWIFDSLTGSHAGSATGLFQLGGESDLAQPIVASIRFPVTLRESTLKKHLVMVYLSMLGHGSAVMAVHGARSSWKYPFELVSSGVTRAKPGKGIRENYMGFSVSTPCGQRFTLDRVEALLKESSTRRVGHGS